MAGINDPKVVDLVALSKDGTVELIIVDDIEDDKWVGTDVQAQKLRDKINNYLEFILGGHFAVQHPKYSGKPLRIRLMGFDNFSDSLSSSLSEILKKDNIGFLWTVFKK